MAYLIGMILGNGEIQKGNQETIVTIDIPHKNLYTDDFKDVKVYVKASIVDIRSIVEPLIGSNLRFTQGNRSTKISFVKPNEEYVMRQILKFVGNGRKHSTMEMNPDLFNITTDEKKSLLRGMADVTGYIRKSNIAYGQMGAHRVYIEIPCNWQMVIDVANMLKDVDIPVQTIDFGHPNFRDSKLKKYNEGKKYYWKKEHQIKIYANEFLPTVNGYCSRTPYSFKNESKVLACESIVIISACLYLSSRYICNHCLIGSYNSFSLKTLFTIS